MSRLDEFVWYHINGDCEANGMLLKAYAENNQLNEQNRTDLAFFYTLTYSVSSAIYLFENERVLAMMSKQQLQSIKNNIVFQSDRKYMKMRDCFVKSIDFWKNNIKGKANIVKQKLCSGNKIRHTATKTLESWYGIGRYAAYLFLECYCNLFDIVVPPSPEDVQFKDGNVFTAGIYHCFGLDEEAERIDKCGTTDGDDKTRAMMGEIIKSVENAGGDANFFNLETSLCAYRKHFKGSRYNGYYADRQLEEIKAFESKGINQSNIYALRKQAIPEQYLGEIGGWNGIRKELKKSYLQGSGILGNN